MGIKSLTKLIKDKSPESIKTDQLHNLSGKKVAIDASLILYQCLLNVRNKGSSLKNDNDKVTSHINGIFYKVINYLSLNIEPIFIFDGKPPEEKDKIIKERQSKAKTAKDNIVNAKTIEEKNKLEKKSIRLTSEHIDDIKKLLSLMGVTYLHIEGEGEAIASELCRIGYVDYVITEDMDSLVFGCPKLIRNCLDKNIKRKDIISIIDLENIKKDLNITQERFIELCILCGCDYLSNINKIGQSKALQIINKYENIEDFINSKHKYNIPEDYMCKFTKAKHLFMMYQDKLNPETLPFVKSNINKLELEKYLVNECSISEKRVINALKKIENIYK
jgi:flap endonuclease-1